jgi:hypothetical protein
MECSIMGVGISSATFFSYFSTKHIITGRNDVIEEGLTEYCIRNMGKQYDVAFHQCNSR